jgi:signal transduction histidine kinase
MSPTQTDVITLELADGLPKVAAVEADLGRVILNLVSNACEAISSAERENPDSRLAITLSTGQTSDNLVEIHIRDTGTGIPREDYERIFEPFFTTKAAGEGTGLGLAISRDIVLKHEGQISVHSDPGKFTEFVVALPIALAPVGASV